MTAIRHLMAVALAIAVGVGCGQKGAPRPPEDVAPVAVTELSAANRPDGIRLSWERPRLDVGGLKLTDLGSFEIWRASGTPNAPFEKIATIPVDDRQRFQQARRFAHVDNGAVAGNLYQYYVLVLTVDGYRSDPSNIATITRTENASH